MTGVQEQIGWALKGTLSIYTTLGMAEFGRPEAFTHCTGSMG
jgi:hypothetical protein